MFDGLAPCTVYGILNDMGYLISCESGIFDRADLKKPSYGIFSNKGNLELNDFDGKILEYANSGILNNEANITVDLENTLVKINGGPKRQRIATMKTKSFSYDAENKKVSVEFSDDLETWYEENAKHIQEFDPEKPITNATFHAVLVGLTGAIKKQISANNSNYLRNLRVGTYVPIKGKSFGNIMTDFCVATQSHLYCQEDGKNVVYYDGGS